MNMNIKPGTAIVRNQAGFTIIEVLIAIAIFSIGFMAVGGLQIRSLSDVSTSTDRTIAMATLEDWVEVLKQTPFYMDDVWDHDTTDDDGLYGTEFDLSPEFRDQGTDPDFTLTGADTEGQYDVHWWVDNPVMMPDRWVDTTGTISIPVAITVRATVTRTGGDPENDALMSVQFAKYWVTDH